MHSARTVLLLMLLAPFCVRAQTDSTAPAADSVNITAPDSTAADPPWYNQTLRPVSLNPRHIPDRSVDSLRARDDFWYVAVGKDKPVPPKPRDPHENWWQRFVHWLWDQCQKPWVVFMLWTLLAGALVAAIVYIVQSASGVTWFHRNRGMGGVDDSQTIGDVSDTPAQALQKALAAGDYRQAERCLYLAALQRLGEKGLVSLLREKTNRDYLRELRGNAVYDAFARLTRHYDYTWYGGFVPSQTAFDGIRAEYDQFQNRLDTL